MNSNLLRLGTLSLLSSTCLLGCNGTNSNASPNDQTASVLEVSDSDKDGVTDEHDLCPDTSNLTTVNNNGCAPGVHAIFFVASSGSDRNPGTEALPFRTLHQAQYAVRKLNQSLIGDVLVYVRGGLHALDAPLVFSGEDSGTNGYHIVYQAYEGERPIISGGTPVTHWTVYDAAEGLYRAQLDSHMETRQFYVNGERAIRARSLNADGWIQNSNGYRAPTSILSWANKGDLEVVLQKNWKSHRGPVESVIDMGSYAQVNMAQPFWDLANLRFVVPPVWIENAYELLDSEGEWYLDRSTKEIYYKPINNLDMTSSEAIVPNLEMLIIGSNVNHLKFRGLTFSHATWLEPSTDMGLAHAQAQTLHAGENYELRQIPGTIVFSDSSHIVFEENVFEHLGATGLEFGTGSKDNLISNNRFRDISCSAVSIGSIEWDQPLADPQDEVRGNVVYGNQIQNVANEFHGCVGIFVGLSQETTINNNEIRNLPYTGISIGWGWRNTVDAGQRHEIAYNLIDSVVLELSDGGGIYTLSAQRNSEVFGNVIQNQRNYGAAMYPDQGTGWSHWHHNVIIDSFRWLHIWTPSIIDNIVESNYTNTIGYREDGTNTQLINNSVVAGYAWPQSAIKILENSGPQGQPSFMRDNIAVNMPSLASTELSPSNSSQYGNDGKLTTAWASADEGAPYYQIDLGAAVRIARIEVASRHDTDEPSLRTNIEIRASDSASFDEYAILARIEGPGFPRYGSWIKEIDTSNEFRYVRAQRIHNAGPLSIAEMRILEYPPGPVPDSNMAVNKPNLFSSSLSYLQNGNYGNDGDVTTYWESAPSELSPYYQIDLVRPTAIGRIELVARQDVDEPSARTNLAIWASNSAGFESYSVLGSLEGTSYPDQTPWVLEQFDITEKYRFIRIQRSNDAGSFHFSELRVFR